MCVFVCVCCVCVSVCVCICIVCVYVCDVCVCVCLCVFVYVLYVCMCVLCVHCVTVCVTLCMHVCMCMCKLIIRSFINPLLPALAATRYLGITKFCLQWMLLLMYRVWHMQFIDIYHHGNQIPTWYCTCWVATEEFVQPTDHKNSYSHVYSYSVKLFWAPTYYAWNSIIIAV